MSGSEITANFTLLLRKMGHDMRVPLNTLISTSDMLAQGVYDPLTPKQAKANARLQRSSQRLLAMLDDFVTYVKADAGELDVSRTEFNLTEKLELWSQPMQPLLNEQGVQLQIAVSGTEAEAPLISSDETLLKRIMQALVWNAVSFTTSGAIHVTAEAQAGAQWLICVRDTGTGIPADDVPHIFEPFWRGEGRPQVPTAGAGLGLPLAQALARIMPGHLWLKETSVLGTCFCVMLEQSHGASDDQVLAHARY